MGRALIALVVVLAFVALPALHAHGTVEGDCAICAWSSTAAVVPSDAPPSVLAPEAGPGVGAPAARAPRSRLSIYRPLALSPPVTRA